MKYTTENIAIPQNKRSEINEKILYIIDSEISNQITANDIFNTYTGNGGLHGLNYKDFNNFSEYTEAKKEKEFGQFFTPAVVCEFIVNCIKPTKFDICADFTFGMGTFFNFLPAEENIYGSELDIKAYKVAKYLYPNANIQAEDIRHYDPGIKMDIVFGNPPFNLNWSVNSKYYISQLYYCKKAFEHLKPAGLLSLIVPCSFMNDEFMDKSIIESINKMFNFVCQFDLPNTAFKSFGVDSFDTKIMFFQKQSEHLENIPYNTSKIVLNTLDGLSADVIYKNHIKPLLEVKESLKNRIFYEISRSKDSEFSYKVSKLLYDVKRNPKINKYYPKCTSYVERFYTQKKPVDMKYEEWERSKITPNKVVAYLEKYLKKQNEVQTDIIKLVKNKYGLKLKAYSNKYKTLLSKSVGVKSISFNDMVVENQYPFDDEKYKKIFLRKKSEYENQSKPWGYMADDISVTKFLNEISLKNNISGEIIKLNPIQKADLNLQLQKNYSLLNWQMGSGKTIAGIVWYKYRFSKNNARNAFIVSSSLSINMTWNEVLKNFNENFIKIDSMNDVKNIKTGMVVIISFDMLVKYQKQIKKYVKMQSQKVSLVIDESDELTNPKSERTKATLNCFRKVHYKIETTGTTTRNTIGELYSQLEILYNNSINMLCTCDLIYRYDKEEEVIKEESCEGYMLPFPAYSAGVNLFKSCFSPLKASVFGIKKHNQDVYNMGELKKIIEKTIITRKFIDIVGEKKYEIINHKVHQNDEEREVYKKIIDEFCHIKNNYFDSTGNSRKDSMLRIIQQIQLMIKSTSIPHRFKEYNSYELPSKYYKVFELLHKFKNEKVALGSVFLETAIDYYELAQNMFPDRKIFLIKGDIPFRTRKKIIEEFESTINGILFSTQQSLRASVNIGSVDKVIVESLPWNIPKLEQYFFRFIRYNSKGNKEIHIITYDYTIEQNMLALLMTKEKLNEYVKTLNFKDDAEIFDEYGIDLEIMTHIIEKEKDSEGRVKLSWGEQKAV